MSSKSRSFNAHILVACLNGNIFGDVSFEHDLGRIPLEAFILSKGANQTIWRGTTAWTSTTIYLRSAVDGCVALLLF